MDLLARLLQRRPAAAPREPPQRGGGSPVTPVAGPVPTATATAIVAPFSIANCETHETSVEFTRDLVVQLVENLPTKSLKVEPPVVQIIGEPHSKGSQSPCKSLAVSENSFTSVSGDGAESGQLCSADADKKQVDTDTDTTEYESAGDSTVPPSPLGSLAGDGYAHYRSFLGADSSPVGAKCSPCAQVEQTTEKAEDPISDATVELPQVQNVLNITGLCSAFEGVSLNAPQGGVESPLVPEPEKPSNISGLCSALESVRLNTSSSAVSESASDSICDSSLELQSTPLSKEKLPVPFRTPNFAEYCKAVKGDSEPSVSSLLVSGEPTENVCQFVGSFSEEQNTLQGGGTPVVERCNTEAKLVDETKFFTELSNKTSTSTDEIISTTEKAEGIVKELVETALESVLVSSAEKACTKLDEAFEFTPDAIPATVVEPKCLKEETSEHLSVANSVLLSAVAKSLQETFELPEVSSGDKTEATAEPLNQTFEVLTDVGQELKSEVVQPLDTSFDFLPEPSGDIKTEESLNTTFEHIPEDSLYKTEAIEQLLNTTFELDEELVGEHPEIENSNSAVVNGDGKETLFNGIDLNGNTPLQAVERVKGERENLSRKSVSSPPVKFVSLHSERESKYNKNAVNISNCTDQFLQQVLCADESDTCETARQDHALPSHVSGDEQCEVSDTSKLIELYKICDEQQRDLEKDDEFVNAESFFRNEQVVLKSSEASLSSSVCEDLPKVKSDTTDSNREVTFEQISVEAKRLSQQFAISASEITAHHSAGNVPDVTEMENSNRAEGTNRSGLGSTPVSNRQSPRSVHGSRGSSPAKRPVGGDAPPKNKQKGVSNALKELDYTEVDDPFKRRSRIQNSPPRDAPVPCRDVSKKDGVDSPLQNSFSNCHNHSEAGPEIAEVPGSEAFKDPSAFEFLSSVGSQQQSERNARLESLYVKFDPLVGTRASTDSGLVLPPGITNGSHTEEDRLGNRDNVRPQQTPGKPAAGDAGSNGVQVTPSPATLLVDKLISLSPSPGKLTPVPSPPRQQAPSPRKAVDGSPAHQTPVARRAQPSPAPKPGLSEMEQTAMLEELLRLKELLGEQDEVHAHEAAKQEQEMAYLQSRLVEAEERLAKASKQVQEKAKTTKDMGVVLDEYEKTISRLIADKEQEQRAHELQVSAIVKERDAHKGHLDTIEIAFSDLHKKYERSKEIIEGLRKNEEVLRSSLAEFESSIRVKEQQYEALKKHAVGQLEDANRELDAVRRAHAGKTAKLQAMLKKAELKVSSLEEMLEQKMKENQELTHICDELITKVGAGN